MQILSSADVVQALPYAALVDALDRAFKQGADVPLRHHHTVPTQSGGENTLLLMPCWQTGGYLGTKIAMVCPENTTRGLGAVTASYVLMDAETGATKAILDGLELTVRRTAAASALASRYLSHYKSQRLLIVGAGNLVPHLIAAHATVRPITEVHIWARRPDQAQSLAAKLEQDHAFPIKAVDDLDRAVGWADIISTATLSTTPLIKGTFLRAGQHVDLVGGYTPVMREADDEALRKAQVYVDTRTGACHEAGDIVQPMKSGVIHMNDIKGDLFDLAARRSDGRMRDDAITLFKSVGTALEDLAAAVLAYEATK